MFFSSIFARVNHELANEDACNFKVFKEEEAVQKRRNVVLTSKTTTRTPQKSTLAGLEPAIPRFVV